MLALMYSYRSSLSHPAVQLLACRTQVCFVYAVLIAIPCASAATTLLIWDNPASYRDPSAEVHKCCSLESWSEEKESVATSLLIGQLCNTADDIDRTGSRRSVTSTSSNVSVRLVSQSHRLDLSTTLLSSLLLQQAI